MATGETIVAIELKFGEGELKLISYTFLFSFNFIAHTFANKKLTNYQKCKEIPCLAKVYTFPIKFHSTFK